MNCPAAPAPTAAAQDLVGAAGRIWLAVRLLLERRRQGRAEPGAEDGDDKVAIGRLGDLLLD
jgi:hypothetical protein